MSIHISPPDQEHTALWLYVEPSFRPDQPTLFSGVFTRIGVALVRSLPGPFALGMIELRQRCKTPIELIRGPRLFFIDGHECPSGSYGRAIDVGRKFQDDIWDCLSLRSVLVIPDEVPILLRAT